MEIANRQSGFAALISVLIIAAVLTVMAAAVSTGVFFSRFNVLDREDKAKSFELARACVDAARLALAESPGSGPTGIIDVGTKSCTIKAIQTNTPSAGQITVQTKAVVNQSVTNLEAVFTAADLSLVSWQELPGL